jgi:hypothetical protein
MPSSWIIFCRVVDHFGDAGFCWRLSVALRQLGMDRVILVIDRPDVLDDLRGIQRVDGVLVLAWDSVESQWRQTGVPPEHQADVVIEAFACNPPPEYLQAFTPTTKWLTLDYLATEPWADSVHGQLSPSPAVSHPAARTRRWAVPGFSAATGGLVHGSWRHITSAERRAWRERLAGQPIEDDVFLVLAFGYQDAPWSALEALLAKDLPAGFSSHRFWTPKGLEYSQIEFDEILQSCDLNFVRGEDSFVRAHWSAAGPWRVPFVWQPYRQEERAHGDKLAGWLNQMVRGSDLRPLEAMHWAWNGIRPNNAHETLTLAHAWRDLAARFDAVSDGLHHACLGLAGRPSLEAHLVAMCGRENKARNG